MGRYVNENCTEIGSTQRFYGHVCDVSSEESCDQFCEATAGEMGVPHINCLFNNAGFGGSASIFEDRDVFDAILDVSAFLRARSGWLGGWLAQNL